MRFPIINKIPTSFIKYSFIGGFVFIVDTGSFMSFLRLGVSRPIASSIAFTIGVLCHFTLNRKFSFQNFDRDIRHQIRTYIVISFVAMVLTVATIEVLAGWFKVMPLIAKITTVAINWPAIFLGHKYFTFGKGIRGTLRELLGED